MFTYRSHPGLRRQNSETAAFCFGKFASYKIVHTTDQQKKGKSPLDTALVPVASWRHDKQRRSNVQKISEAADRIVRERAAVIAKRLAGAPGWTSDDAQGAVEDELRLFVALLAKDAMREMREGMRRGLMDAIDDLASDGRRHVEEVFTEAEKRLSALVETYGAGK